MKFKIGNDIIEISRIEKLCEKYKDRFKKRVFTEKEIRYCECKGKNKYQSYAARFCAKEAVFKAISDGLNNKYEINWTDIEIINNEKGKPIVNINLDFIKDVEISISHIKEYAIATVIVEYI